MARPRAGSTVDGYPAAHIKRHATKERTLQTAQEPRGTWLGVRPAADRRTEALRDGVAILAGRATGVALERAGSGRAQHGGAVP